MNVDISNVMNFLSSLLRSGMAAHLVYIALGLAKNGKHAAQRRLERMTG